MIWWYPYTVAEGSPQWDENDAYKSAPLLSITEDVLVQASLPTTCVVHCWFHFSSSIYFWFGTNYLAVMGFLKSILHLVLSELVIVLFADILSEALLLPRKPTFAEREMYRFSF